MTINPCDDVKGALLERVLDRSNSDIQLLRESKDAETWWDRLPGKRKRKVVDILGLDSNLTRKTFSQIDAEDQSEIEAYFTKHKGRVESFDFSMDEATPLHTTNKLGTKIPFMELKSNGRTVYGYQVGHIFFRIVPERDKWRLDKKPGPFPWEAVTSKAYDSPQAAARDAIKPIQDAIDTVKEMKRRNLKPGQWLPDNWKREDVEFDETVANILGSDATGDSKSEAGQLAKKIEAAIKKHMPPGHLLACRFEVNRFKPSEGHIYIMTTLRPKGEWKNGIIQNDPALQKFFVNGMSADGKLRDKLTADSTGGVGKLLVKPEPGSHYAYGSVKFGWRKKAGTPDQIVKHFDSYYAKVAKIIKDNKANLKEDVELDESRSPRLRVGDVIRVEGFVMLKGLDDGKRYRVIKVDDVSYTFSAIRGNKPVARHRIGSVDRSLRDASDSDLNKIIKEDVELGEEVKAGQYFVLVDVSVAGGKLVKRELYHGVKKADQEAAKLNKQGRNVQVIDAVWYEPARAIMKAQGMIGEDEEFDEEVKAGQYFVLVDISVPGGKLVKRKLYHGAKEADKEAAKLNKIKNWPEDKHKEWVQVIDAMWYEPARAIMKAQGMIGEGEGFDEGCKTPGMKKRSKGKGKGLAKGEGKGPLGVPVGDKDWTEELADKLRERVMGESQTGVETVTLNVADVFSESDAKDKAEKYAMSKMFRVNPQKVKAVKAEKVGGSNNRWRVTLKVTHA